MFQLLLKWYFNKSPVLKSFDLETEVSRIKGFAIKSELLSNENQNKRINK